MKSTEATPRITGKCVVAAFILGVAGCQEARSSNWTDVPLPLPRALADAGAAPPVATASPSASCVPRPARLVFAHAQPNPRSYANTVVHPQIATSPDSRLLATPGIEGAIVVYDLATGAVRGELLQHRGEVRGVAFIDSTTLVSVGVDGFVRVWDLARGTPTAELDLGTEPTTLAVSPRDGTVAIGATDGKLRLLPRSGAAPRVIDAHSREVHRVAFRPDGTEIASVGADGMVYRYQADGSGRLAQYNLAGRFKRCSLAFRPGTDEIAIGETDGVVLLIGPNHRLRQLSEWSNAIGRRGNTPTDVAFAFSGDGQRLAAQTRARGNVSNFALVDVVHDRGWVADAASGGGFSCAVAADWSADGRRIALMDCDHSVALFDPTTRRTVGGRSPQFDDRSPEHALRHLSHSARYQLEDRVARALGATFLPERDEACEALRSRVARDETGGFSCGAGLAFAGKSDGSIGVYRGSASKWERSYTPHSSRGVFRHVRRLTVSPDGLHVASWADDGAVVVASAAAPHPTTRERRGIGGVTRIGFSPDSRFLAIWSTTTLRVLRLADGAMLRIEDGVASDESGAFELLPEAPVVDHRGITTPEGAAVVRAKLRVRLGDIAAGDLVTLEQARSLAKPGLARGFLSGAAPPAVALSACPP